MRYISQCVSASLRLSMKRRNVLLSFIAVIGLAASADADVTYQVIEYRVIKGLDQIRLTSTSIHDETIQERLFRAPSRFDRAGLILGLTKSPRSVVRRETIGGHHIEIRIDIAPSRGRGFRGGMPSARFSVTVDNEKRIDCAYDEADVQFKDVGILVSDDRIALLGTFRDVLFNESVPLKGGPLIDRDWLRALRR